jgi:hypothetical protein
MQTRHDDRSPVAPIPAHQAFRALRVAFAVLPVIAGADKFANRLTVWPHYLARPISEMLPMSPAAFMHAIGAGEILAGVIVAFSPIVGGWIVAGWLWAVVVNLVLVPGYYDVALRDLGLSLGAVALARLGAAFAVDVERGAFGVAEPGPRRDLPEPPRAVDEIVGQHARPVQNEPHQQIADQQQLREVLRPKPQVPARRDGRGHCSQARTIVPTAES